MIIILVLVFLKGTSNEVFHFTKKKKKLYMIDVLISIYSTGSKYLATGGLYIKMSTFA